MNSNIDCIKISNFFHAKKADLKSVESQFCEHIYNTRIATNYTL